MTILAKGCLLLLFVFTNTLACANSNSIINPDITIKISKKLDKKINTHLKTPRYPQKNTPKNTNTIVQVPPVYERVAEQSHLPAELFYVMALAESGYQKREGYRPWPWTLNIEGKPYRFQRYTQARLHLILATKQGKSVDVGLMQINSRWHAHRVLHITDYLNPYINLAKAADILVEQRRRSRDWWEAVGRYHAPGNDLASLARAERYRQRIRKIGRQLGYLW